MNDSEEDLSGDITAAYTASKQILRYRELSQKFRHAWTDFEVMCVLFFEHLDLEYRTPLVDPLLPNLDANIEKLKQLCNKASCRPEFAEPLNLLVALQKALCKDPMQWVESTIYKQRSCDQFFVSVHKKSLFISVKDINSLAEKFAAAHESLRIKYNEFRSFEHNLQLILLLYLKRKQLTPKSKRMLPQVFAVLCDVLAANLKLENKLNVGFVSSACDDAMDIVFKPTSITCHTYDLMDSMKQAVGTARQELDGPIREVLGVAQKEVSVDTAQHD